jgi:hypothetical protein
VRSLIYSVTEIRRESDFIAFLDLSLQTSLRQVSMIFMMSSGLVCSSGANASHVASIAGASSGSEDCSESLVTSGIVLCASSEMADIILMP